jgi:hypothetical protein
MIPFSWFVAPLESTNSFLYPFGSLLSKLLNRNGRVDQLYPVFPSRQVDYLQKKRISKGKTTLNFTTNKKKLHILHRATSNNFVTGLIQRKKKTRFLAILTNFYGMKRRIIKKGRGKNKQSGSAMLIGAQLEKTKCLLLFFFLSLFFTTQLEPPVAYQVLLHVWHIQSLVSFYNISGAGVTIMTIAKFLCRAECEFIQKVGKMKGIWVERSYGLVISL